MFICCTITNKVDLMLYNENQEKAIGVLLIYNRYRNINYNIYKIMKDYVNIIQLDIID